MAVYKTVSINEVIGRIYRNTKLTDSSWLDDIYNWLWEGMESVRVRTVLQPASMTVKVKNHMAEIPCEAVVVDAIAYGGYRLRQSNNVLDVPQIPTEFKNAASNTLFLTTETKITTTDLETTLKTSEFKYNVDFQTLPLSSSDYYKLALNTIQTSFAEGEIIVFYLYYETDQEGIITIPDNEALKTYLYWYVLTMMLGAGFEHKVFKYADAEQRMIAGRQAAINSLRNWTPDRAFDFSKTWVRLMPPTSGFHNSFMLNSGR